MERAIFAINTGTKL